MDSAPAPATAPAKSKPKNFDGLSHQVWRFVRALGEGKDFVAAARVVQPNATIRKATWKAAQLLKNRGIRRRAIAHCTMMAQVQNVLAILELVAVQALADQAATDPEDTLKALKLLRGKEGPGSQADPDAPEAPEIAGELGAVPRESAIPRQARPSVIARKATPTDGGTTTPRT